MEREYVDDSSESSIGVTRWMSSDMRDRSLAKMFMRC